MGIYKVQQCERTKLEQFLGKIQLSNTFKNIGIFTAILSFIALTSIKFIEGEPSWLQPVLKHIMLIGLLITSLSKEKIEDELIENLRSKSYALAFIIGVLYTLAQPLVNYIVDIILGKEDVPSHIGYVQVLLLLLLIQVMFFEVLKRNR